MLVLRMQEKQALCVSKAAVSQALLSQRLLKKTYLVAKILKT
jgi:hypothetical protein